MAAETSNSLFLWADKAGIPAGNSINVLRWWVDQAAAERGRLARIARKSGVNYQRLWSGGRLSGSEAEAVAKAIDAERPLLAERKALNYLDTYEALTRLSSYDANEGFGVDGDEDRAKIMAMVAPLSGRAWTL